MLLEKTPLSRTPDEPRRRWFSDPCFDLIVWLDEQGRCLGFQLCYDKAEDERCLTWHRTGGRSHRRVDDGEDRPGRRKAAPVLSADDDFNAADLAARFKRAGRALEPGLGDFVYRRILSWPND